MSVVLDACVTNSLDESTIVIDAGSLGGKYVNCTSLDKEYGAETSLVVGTRERISTPVLSKT